jgi:hypothetical protein
VDVPDELRNFDRSPRWMSTKKATVSVATPIEFDAAREWPVLLVSASSEAGSNSNSRLLEHYKEAALSAGWIIVASDPVPAVAKWEDTLSLRFVLDLLAMAALHDCWLHAGRAPIAFGGYGGGAKFAGWLSSMFVSQNSHVVGVFQAGIEDETLRSAAMQFQVLQSPDFLNVPVYLHGGSSEATEQAGRLRGVQKTLLDAGFKNVGIGFLEGSHPDDPEALRRALAWFDQIAGRKPLGQ